MTFLEHRELCANAKDLRRYVIQQDDRHTKLCDVRGSNVDLTAMLNFEEDVLLALKTFSKGSEMFAVRFDVPVTDGQDGSDGQDEIHPVDAQQEEVAAKTRNALRELKDLVSNKDVRINDFKLSLTGVIAELKGRRRSAMAAELERIARFFSTMAEKSLDVGKGEVRTVGGAAREGSKIGTSNMLNDTLTNLNAAFNLERLKEVLVPCQAAVAELELLPPSVMKDIQATSGFVELMGNFYVSQAPRLLGEINGLLEGLSYHALLLIGKLTSADLLLIFLRKHPGLFDSGALDRAQHRAASNAHATGVLMHLSGLQTLLEPFYNHTLQSLSEMSRHLAEHLRISQDGQECLSVAHLMNVCENWDEVEIYFRDSGDTNTDTEDIQRSVIIYQETGKFISALSAHPGGSALSLSYQQRAGKHVRLSPEQLQAHVQWAVLGGDVTVLEEFVSAFREAQRAHAIRLKLEDEGHPDHQAIYPPASLGKSCRVCDVSEAAGGLSVELSLWCENTAKFCEESPRLRLLNRRNRVQLLLALRNPESRSVSRLLPYAAQCFPSLFAQRDSVYDALRISILTLEDSPDLYDLALAGLLMMRIESILRLNPDCDGCLSAGGDTNETFEATRLDLMGSSGHDIYCQHLSYMINQTYGVAQPGMVLWGQRTTTEREVQDLLLVAGTSDLAGAVHVVGVDQLTPRIREVLLRGIECTSLRCPLLLIFGDRDGIDSFSQYQAEIMPEKRVSADVRPHLWSSISTDVPTTSKIPDAARVNFFREYFAGRTTDTLNIPPSSISQPTSRQNAEVWVVAGKSGMGKTRWIEEHQERSHKSICLNFTVHEGFTAQLVIDRFAILNVYADSKVILFFDVHALGCLESFNLFLHHLLALGLIIDDESRYSLAIHPGISLDVFVELPEMPAEYGACEGSAEVCGSNWPPLDDLKWNASQHPLLRSLPALVVAVAHDHYISVRAADPYLSCRKAKLVANYLLFAREGRNLYTNLHDPDLPVPDILNILEEELFAKYQVSTTKRVRNFLINLLHVRFTYLKKMLQHVSELQLQEDSDEDPLEVRLAGSPHEVLKLFMKEALDIASAAETLPETSVFTIRPERVEEFEVLVATHNNRSNDFQYWKSKFMESKELIINEGSIPPMLRANVAPAFGMEDTSGMLSTLQDCGHLLTPESLVRILHMHSRRMLGASIIYEGETGVGKSQNLKLYSLLINSNNALFANLKLHLVAVVNATAEIKRGTAEDAVDDEQGIREAAEALSAIKPSSSLAEVC